MIFEMAVLEIESSGFKWEKVSEYFPVADYELREGNYEKLVTLCLEKLESPADKELLLDLLDAQSAVTLEQLWIQNEKSVQSRERNVVAVHFVSAWLQINANLRYENNLVGRNMRQRMMSMGATDTIAKVLCA
jgi:hypothetical protein